jgi:hypothetical protein
LQQIVAEIDRGSSAKGENETPDAQAEERQNRCNFLETFPIKIQEPDYKG